MEPILKTLTDLGGVTAALVFDPAGALLGHGGRSIYDRPLCEQVSAALGKAIDAVQLQQADWESITAHFADGKLILRRIGVGADRTHVLAVVADATLNASFAAVAIRVAAGKLKKLLEGGPGASSPGASSSLLGSNAGAPSASRPGESRPGDSRPVLANSGLSWSKISSVGLSRVAVADPASGMFLTRCARELAVHVGPISKVFVEEAVRRVSPEAPFSLALSAALVEDLAGQVEDAQGRREFLKAMSKA